MDTCACGSGHGETPNLTVVSRSHFLRALASVSAVGLLGAWYDAPVRTLDLVGLYSGERYQAAFTRDGVHLDPTGYIVLCDALRDDNREIPTSRAVVQIVPALLQLLWEIQVIVTARHGARPIVVHSGYRTRASNRETKGSVPNSMHIAGAACDFHIDGVHVAEIRDIAAQLPLIGGLGYYPPGTEGSPTGWIHADVGRHRSW